MGSENLAPVDNSAGDIRMIAARNSVDATFFRPHENWLTTDPGSVGRKLLLGAFSSKREEFLYVNTESPERAEAIVFKCHKKNSSPT